MVVAYQVSVLFLDEVAVSLPKWGLLHYFFDLFVVRNGKFQLWSSQ